ncbi:unnamed protein product [Linum tenue]|uniref:RING-type E3 ubiquitin transferase n=1 Tax=Linum tenue TaxID=586396 RepID=A0AAV0HUL7_9ROSI|nr:unnamed protein product [Linum tenue]
MTFVAVAVNGGEGIGGRGSRRALRWAVEKCLPTANRFALVHVMPFVTSVPTPSGDRIPVEELDGKVVALYLQEVRKEVEEIFVPFVKLCRERAAKNVKVETLVLEDDNPAAALVRCTAQLGITTLVLGSCSASCLLRRKQAGLPANVYKSAPVACNVHVVHRTKVKTKLATSSIIDDISSRCEVVGENDYKKLLTGIDNQASEVPSFSRDSKAVTCFDSSSVSDLCWADIQALENAPNPFHGSLCMEGMGDTLEYNVLSSSVDKCCSTSSSKRAQSYVYDEVEKLRQELRTTIAMYKQACEELIHTQNKVELLSSECIEESRRVMDAREREETLQKIAAEEKARCANAMDEVDKAKELLANEVYERQVAELKANKESSGKQRIVDKMFASDARCKKYTKDEIEVATEFFAEDKVIGEGGYGKVYKCNVDHTPVAIKVLQRDALGKKEEFLREVQVLSQLRHPNLVLLLGACTESGCLVYEYLENGSLEDCLLNHSGKIPLPWFVRFKIVFEIACGLSFLHNSKPEPIVHRDLKPGNILLDRNYVSKIGDVGLAKLITEVVPDNVTEYRDSMLAGTLFYMDPEYQRTGTIRPKSDLYAFGIIVLQVLTGCRPNGLLVRVEEAVRCGTLANILDPSIADWPLGEAKELAQIALNCVKLRCRDRPDLDTEVLPVLRRLGEVADASMKTERCSIYAPSYYFCPILKEVMDDPHIAADGFTYEKIAIKTWLERHNISPVTKLRLQHSDLTPNHMLRSAIREWMSRVNSQ